MTYFPLSFYKAMVPFLVSIILIAVWSWKTANDCLLKAIPEVFKFRIVNKVKSRKASYYVTVPRQVFLQSSETRNLLW